MLDHYYTPRDPLPAADGLLTNYVSPAGVGIGAGEKPKPLPPRTVVDLTSLNLDQIPFSFDCDSDDEDQSGSDDGYVSTLLRLQKSLPIVSVPRKIAGARRVARAVSSPAVPTTMSMEVESDTTGAREANTAPEGEIFQSITAIPGLETMSFEELRLETYLQSLIATGSARPQPAFTPAMVIPPAFSPQFCEWDPDSASNDVEMDAPSAASPLTSSPPSVSRSASFPVTAGNVTWL
ncbi:hypothetical protein MIND_01378300 [Mycena indigotica]|uniref:Uncharacterized protein n=1 Tax=Mycena indigotica TaxID=2126181 RepID=A0A8H6VPC9_9AGAR|nr:uncharacterized protein MIND_01378300 [Mycena indigotica]KAF7289172.1 hypothetical protein MIND_01378300 [Mycena indigotica]